MFKYVGGHRFNTVQISVKSLREEASVEMDNSLIKDIRSEQHKEGGPTEQQKVDGKFTDCHITVE